MKNLLNVLFILLFISSCSDTDNSAFPEINDEEENNTEKIIPLKLEIEDTRKNIFDYAVFGLFPNDYFIMFSLSDVYDSITWKVSNLDGSLKIFKQTEGSAKFIRQWSHSFYSPGKYKTYVSGYKNKEVISSDTVEIEITNTKDFLCYNWKDIKGPTGAVGYENVLKRFMTLSRMRICIKESPSVSLYIRDKEKDDRPAFLIRSKKILTDYINSLYNTTPVYDETDDILLKKREELFVYKEENTYPLCIWITPKSRIVLIKNEKV